MNEAFIVLERAKREAEARLARYEQEGKASAHKLVNVRHAIKDIELGLYWLKWANDTRLVFVRLWNLVEEGERHVQILSSTGKRPSSGRSRSNRRRT